MTYLTMATQLAENSKNKREKVFRTFSTLRDALVRLSPDRARFRADADVSDSATSLYVAVVNAIEDMVEIMLVLEKSAGTYRHATDMGPHASG